MADRLVPITDPAVAHSVLGPHEPLSTQMLSAIGSYGLGRSLRAAHVRHDGETVGAVVQRRVSALRWEAQVLVLDEAAAPALAAAVDAGPAVLLGGFASHCRLIADHLRRLEGSAEIRDVFIVEPGFDFIDPDPGTRLGRPDDIPALVELFWRAGGHPFLFRHELERWFRGAVGRREIHLAADGAEVVGFGHFARAGRYGEISELTVHPDRRHEGIGLRIIARMAEAATRLGIGGVAVFASTNPIPIPPDLFHEDPWWLVRWLPPRRFPGERRLRRHVTDRLQRRVPLGPDQPIFRPGDVSTGPAADPDALGRWRGR